jgi:hypothetical protein
MPDVPDVDHPGGLGHPVPPTTLIARSKTKGIQSRTGEYIHPREGLGKKQEYLGLLGF